MNEEITGGAPQEETVLIPETASEEKPVEEIASEKIEEIAQDAEDVKLIKRVRQFATDVTDFLSKTDITIDECFLFCDLFKQGIYQLKTNSAEAKQVAEIENTFHAKTLKTVLDETPDKDSDKEV